jgi:hypothetical protein
MNDTIVRVEGLDNPYAEQIRDFFLEGFPGLVTNPGDSVLNGIVRALIGTGQTRFGPRPSLESEVAIRDVVRKAIAAERGIPVLVPMGPKKPVIGQSVDIAELSALQTLKRLHECVAQFHAPGLDLRFRIEDFTGWQLEQDRSAGDSMSIYMRDFENLIELLDLKFMEPVRESALIDGRHRRDIDGVAAIVDRLESIFAEYLAATDKMDPADWDTSDEWYLLEAEGWKGLIPIEMREYFQQRLHLIDPSMSKTLNGRLIARYFAVALARGKIGFSGASPEWKDGMIQINFPGPVPGTPKDLASTRLHYRTIPLRHSKSHLPYWRARGYLKVNGEPKIALAKWHEPLDLHEGWIVITNGEKEVRVRSDYMIL